MTEGEWVEFLSSVAELWEGEGLDFDVDETIVIIPTDEADGSVLVPLFMRGRVIPAIVAPNGTDITDSFFSEDEWAQIKQRVKARKAINSAI